LIGFELREGAQVELRLRPSIYEPRGSLQFTVEQARLAGVGRLYEAFMRLKAKLESEGLFDPSTKRALPEIPTRIGLITSPKAAALADMLRVLRDRWPRAQIFLYPASVQGNAAPVELLGALNAANRRGECDVLIIGRGGGSIEDLWAFNDEALVRAVAASSIPIVSAVGHETDFTLCDFAADARAPTPTAAANLVTPERSAAIARVERLGSDMVALLSRRIDTFAQRLDRAHERLRASDRALAPWRERVQRMQARLERAFTVLPMLRRNTLQTLNQRFIQCAARPIVVANARNRLNRVNSSLQSTITTNLAAHNTTLSELTRSIELLNPQNVLDRGYAVIFDANGRAMTDANTVNVGDMVTARLKVGEISARITA
jgi:exodeoxyribonuclease VII large subunit